MQGYDPDEGEDEGGLRNEPWPSAKRHGVTGWLGVGAMLGLMAVGVPEGLAATAGGLIAGALGYGWRRLHG